MKDNKTYPIFSIRLAGYLMMNKQPIIAMSQRDKLNTNQFVYFFNNTDLLHKLINDYKNTTV